MLPEIYTITSDNTDKLIEFHYFFEAKPEAIWRHLTDNHSLISWQPFLIFNELEATSLIEINSPSQNNQEELLALEPPRLIYFTWKKGWIRLELTPHMTLQTHLHFSLWTSDIKDEIVDDISHWVINMEMLEALLANLPVVNRSERYRILSPIVKKEIYKKPE